MPTYRKSRRGEAAAGRDLSQDVSPGFAPVGRARSGAVDARTRTAATSIAIRYAAGVPAARAAVAPADPRPTKTLVTTRRRARTVSRSGPVKCSASRVACAVRCAPCAPTAAHATSVKAGAEEAEQYAASA